MIDDAFQAEVDACLTALEADRPALHALRRVPMDLIAEAVAGELPAPPPGLRVLRWKPSVIQRALCVIAARNGTIVQAPANAAQVID